MKTFNSRTLVTLFNDDYNMGVLLSDNTKRESVLNIDITEIDTLILRLKELRDKVEETQKSKENVLKNYILEKLQENDLFKDLTVDAVISQLSGKVATPISKKNPPKIHEVTFNDNGEIRRFNVTNRQLPRKLKTDPFYLKVIEKNPEFNDDDEFLRAYSADYAKEFAYDAKYGSNVFYCNDKGTLNKKAAVYWADFKKNNPDSQLSDFKQQCKDNFKDTGTVKK
ncbi:hypothetical protein [Yersinia enterocolitica]|uniref:hypothetical protein n=1 Tax=Yersinia enterocolitica TaxID=630 RepID=UPI002857C567|nr:hypothetical protein [Yersinia enterocolitica]HDV5957283.1 hypothetical protein [Yersinia enterocolitica]HEA9986018.1 hypothetical protein [Yersinia enterocolitica]HEN3595624.1 hypothetical protein [Yersinia enterocolitica]